MQKILWNRLKQWLRMSHGALLPAGSRHLCGISDSVSRRCAVRILLFVLLAADCIWMLAVTRSLRHGRENIEKLLKLAELS